MDGGVWLCIFIYFLFLFLGCVCACERMDGGFWLCFFSLVCVCKCVFLKYIILVGSAMIMTFVGVKIDTNTDDDNYRGTVMDMIMNGKNIKGTEKPIPRQIKIIIST